ncbi:hypothetical protein CU098_006061 [Rhizopus stolonifer]|uniref:BHLH domain-containing protein n=1 Tax=Rhizopus stolonifer TaxID=4846 RepID=A0A367IXE6_RHIST|nr:hypothetical protein CU098_006061 [Rhizopus stolonifer]
MSVVSSPTTNNKRKLSATEESENSDNASPKKQQTENALTTNSLHPPLVALPPPLMQYPNGQLVSVVHHPQQAPYYHMQPIYYPVSPQQHHFINTHPSPILAPQTDKKASPRILPKHTDMSPQALYATQQQPQTPVSPFYHPYPFQQISPTLMPSSYGPSRQNSISSSPGLGPSMLSTMTPAATTADQREKARKISHSAIERRRRERINDKIFQLKQLIPSCVEQDNLHKMSILQSAIDYITYLKDVVKKLDEESGGDQLLKGNHLKVKTAKSMLPKEIEPFTNQFPVTQSQDEANEDDDVTSEHKTKGLKPIDVIKSGTPIISTGVTPLTPPQEPQNKNKVSETLCLSDSPTLSNKSRISEEAKHMSLQNILC